MSGGPEAGYDVRVRDDGTGSPAGPDDGLPHHGLASMRERAQILGAKLRVESVPGAGRRSSSTSRVTRPMLA